MTLDDVIKRKPTYKEKGYRRYEIERTPVLIHCFGKRFNTKYFVTWKCSVFLSGKDIFDFNTSAPFNETRFKKDLDRALEQSGKYKLIRAIYNDLQA